MGLRPVQVTTSSTQEDKQALTHTFTPSFIVETIYKTYMFELEKQTSQWGEHLLCNATVLSTGWWATQLLWFTFQT